MKWLWMEKVVGGMGLFGLRVVDFSWEQVGGFLVGRVLWEMVGGLFFGGGGRYGGGVNDILSELGWG